jgi:hypothetical protein
VITNARIIGGGDKLQEFTASYQSAPAPGDVFVSNQYGVVDIYRPDGTRVAAWDTGQPGDATGSAFDAAGNFYVTNFDADTVTRFAPDGPLLGSWGSGYSSQPESILFDASGNGYVGHAGSGFGRLQKRASDGTLIRAFSVATGNRGADWIALRPDGCTMLYTSESSSILRYDVCAEQQLSNFVTSAGGPMFALALLADGGAVVAANSVIRRFDAGGRQVRTYDWSGQDAWFALTLDPDGTSFWASDGDTGEVYRFDLSTGNKRGSFSTGFTIPPGVGGVAVGGLSIMPNLGGAGSLTVPNSSEVSPKGSGGKLPGGVQESTPDA